MTRTVRRGRPLGPIARAVLTLIERQPVTVTGLASELQLSYRAANATVSRLHSAGYVAYGDPVCGQHDRPARLITVAAIEQPVPDPWWPR